MPTGRQDNSINIVLLDSTIISNNNDNPAPTLNIIKSIGLNILNINVPLFALAGTK
mgnify:CR=1 FL=1